MCLKNYESAQAAIYRLTESLGKNNGQRLCQRQRRNKRFIESIMFLTKAYYRTGWQKVLMSNAFWHNSFENPKIRGWCGNALQKDLHLAI